MIIHPNEMCYKCNEWSIDEGCIACKYIEYGYIGQEYDYIVKTAIEDKKPTITKKTTYQFYSRILLQKEDVENIKKCPFYLEILLKNQNGVIGSCNHETQ